ncbi:MAG: GCN5-related N-acetyltransferase [uncultured bacterium]|nr:MAG: GCN5-related N-acetyltransferase [uncultured bacterium]
MELIEPSVKFKNSFIEALKEFQAEGRGTDLDVSRLEENFEGFLAQLEDEKNGVNLAQGYVPASTYWLIDGNEYIGKVSIRHALNDVLIQMGGHVGYEIRPSRRMKGYGSRALEYSFPLLKKLEISKALLTCSDDNIGSWKIIEKNGGILENKIVFNNVLKRRYWIQI